MRTLAGLAIVVLASASAVTAQDIDVTTTADKIDFTGEQRIADLPGPDGVVSLREAIIAANNTIGPQTIGFRIPTTDPGFDGAAFVIYPRNDLPNLSDGGTTIDGSTQAAFSGDTNTMGPEIVLDGSRYDTPVENCGLQLYSPGNRIHSLVIHAFFAGIEIIGASNVVTGCYIGTDATGMEARPNEYWGIVIRYGASHNRIGGSTLAERNVLSGNGYGVFLNMGSDSAPATSDNLIQGNIIGPDAMRTRVIGNDIGLLICAVGTRVVGNVISGSDRWGVWITDTCWLTPHAVVSNTVSRNSIHSNGYLGIDLPGGDPVNPNDPGDADTGPNGLQNYPVLTSAVLRPGRLLVTGTLDTPNPRTAVIEIFANPVPDPGGDPTGHGEGAIFLGTARPNSRGAFTAVLPVVAEGTLISATATDREGNTSEFSENIEARSR
jgi:hypothetical protein